MKQGIYQSLQLRKKEGKKSFAVLIDPDKVNTSMLDELIDLSLAAKVDYFLVGGSLVISNHLDDVFNTSKQQLQNPGDTFSRKSFPGKQICRCFLYLSLISGRNAELLIGQHVVSAPFVKKSGLEIMPQVIW